MKSSFYAKNMKVLRKRMPVFARAVETANNFPTDCEYIVDKAKNSSPTLAIKKDGKVFQIHSKYNPQREAKQQVEGNKFKNPRLLVIFGLGLGYHIRACLEELAETNLFIIVIEKDIQALKTAVEATDLTDLFGSNKIRWVIGVPESEGYAVLNDMLKQAGIALQLFLKTLVIFDHPAIDKIHGDYHQNMARSFREAAHAIIFNYGNCPEDSMIGVKNIMKNLATIMKNPGVRDLKGCMKGVPGIIVSTGPSLDKNIEFLKEAEGKSVMICADSALKILYEHGIKPTAASSLERIMHVATMFKQVPDDFKKDIWLAGTPVIMKESYDAWSGPTFMIYRAFAHFEWIGIEKGTLNVGPSCSNMAFKVLEEMGCDPIILVGQDCAFESAERTHASSAPSVTRLDVKEKDLIKVKGNYSDWVYTNNIFNLFRKSFVTDVAQWRGTCINSTAGGAFIEGTQLMPLDDAINKYCTKEVDIHGIMKKALHYPTEEEIRKEYRQFRRTIIDTRKEVEGVIDYCDKGVKMIDEFEQRLQKDGFAKIEDFLERFPDDELDHIHAEMTRARSKIITFGKYFNLYLMHIVQMIIVKFEMDFNELPSLCDDMKRCKLQSIRLMKRWFPTIGDVCRISLQLLIEAAEDLEKEFGYLV
jgi:hypothetical protein